MSYLVVMLSCHAYDTENGNERLEELHKSLNHAIKSGIVYEEKGLLVILLAGYEQKRVKEKMRALCRKDSNIYIGIGSQEEDMQHIYKSYHNAYTAYQLTKTEIKDPSVSCTNAGYISFSFTSASNLYTPSSSYTKKFLLIAVFVS